MGVHGLHADIQRGGNVLVAMPLASNFRTSSSRSVSSLGCGPDSPAMRSWVWRSFTAARDKNGLSFPTDSTASTPLHAELRQAYGRPVCLAEGRICAGSRSCHCVDADVVLAIRGVFRRVQNGTARSSAFRIRYMCLRPPRTGEDFSQSSAGAILPLTIRSSPLSPQLTCCRRGGETRGRVLGGDQRSAAGKRATHREYWFLDWLSDKATRHAQSTPSAPFGG
jgi:hypothetical protein